jgi:hypothetical protein
VRFSRWREPPRAVVAASGDLDRNGLLRKTAAGGGSSRKSESQQDRQANGSRCRTTIHARRFSVSGSAVRDERLAPSDPSGAFDCMRFVPVRGGCARLGWCIAGAAAARGRIPQACEPLGMQGRFRTSEGATSHDDEREVRPCASRSSHGRSTPSTHSPAAAISEGAETATRAFASGRLRRVRGYSPLHDADGMVGRSIAVSRRRASSTGSRVTRWSRQLHGRLFHEAISDVQRDRSIRQDA